MKICANQALKLENCQHKVVALILVIVEDQVKIKIVLD